MALNNTALNTGSTAIAAQITHLSLHTTGAVTSSANESAAARQPSGMALAGGGPGLAASNIAFTGGTPNGPVVRVGYWSALTGGTYLGGALLTGDQTFNSAGTYTVTSISETVTSS